MTTQEKVNAAGMARADYRGLPSTLCQGCGHNSIANQIIAACYELDIIPENVVKFSGIGCSSKSPTYFLSRSFGFNGLHGRMPSLALGALFADTTIKGFGVSGDGDTASIGMGQFKHVMRRNLPMVFIIENNGVYGLTKGQFSATAERGLMLKHEGTNMYTAVDICKEALVSNATFVARSFAGDPKQVKELIKAALRHNGMAVLDIISPCVTFNNQDTSMHSYAWGKDHEVRLHDISFLPVPARDEITLEDFEQGTIREVELHDGSVIRLKKLAEDYDPSDRWQALRVLESAECDNCMVTGLVYVDTAAPSMFELYDMPAQPLNRMQEYQIRPSRESIDEINRMML